jgi:hypothetical protein
MVDKQTSQAFTQWWFMVVKLAVLIRKDNFMASKCFHSINNLFHHHKKHQGLGHLARPVSRITAALANVSSVSQLFSFLVDCSGMILKGFGFVAFCAGVKACSFCIHLSCLVCINNLFVFSYINKCLWSVVTSVLYKSNPFIWIQRVSVSFLLCNLPAKSPSSSYI